MWRFAAAGVVGSSHLKLGMPCQDQLACAVLLDGTLVAAVADGAGSSKSAEKGAQVAVDVVMRSVSTGVESGRTDFAAMLTEAAEQARKEIVAVAHEHRVEIRELASTLLAVVIGPAGGAAYHIGDGVIVARTEAGAWGCVFWPQHGEYANTTCFLTDEDAASRKQVESFTGRVVDIALMSDGLESLALHHATKSVHQPFFNGMFEPLRQVGGNNEIPALSTELSKFLESERVRSRTDDDISLILATRAVTTNLSCP